MSLPLLFIKISSTETVRMPKLNDLYVLIINKECIQQTKKAGQWPALIWVIS